MEQETSLRARLGLSQKDFLAVGGAIYAYLFHRITQRELLSYLDNRELAERVLEAVRSDGYTMMNCKLYAHACWCARQAGEKFPKAADYEIHKDDVALLKRINLSHLSSHYAPMTLADMESMIEGAFDSPAMRAHIGKFVSKKMTFLIRSYGVPRDDIVGDLKRAALAAIYKTYPRFESALHFTNVAKSAIHNAGMSLIAYHTRASRNRLVQDEHAGHQAVHDESAQMADIPAPAAYLEHAKDALQSLVSLSPRMSERVQEFLLAAAGHHHEGLSEFMRRDNSEAVDDMQYPQYLETLRSYFGVTEAQTQKLFKSLRSHLSQ